jgi:hypothetical protein
LFDAHAGSQLFLGQLRLDAIASNVFSNHPLDIHGFNLSAPRQPAEPSPHELPRLFSLRFSPDTNASMRSPFAAYDTLRVSHPPRTSATTPVWRSRGAKKVHVPSAETAGCRFAAAEPPAFSRISLAPTRFLTGSEHVSRAGRPLTLSPATGL